MPGIAADQHQRTFHHAPAEHAVKFSDARRRAGARFLRDFGKAHRACARARALLDRLDGRSLLRSLRGLFLQSVPRVAAGHLPIQRGVS